MPLLHVWPTAPLQTYVLDVRAPLPSITSIRSPPAAQLDPDGSVVTDAEEPGAPASPSGPCGPVGPGRPAPPAGPCGPVAPARSLGSRRPCVPRRERDRRPVTATTRPERLGGALAYATSPARAVAQSTGTQVVGQTLVERRKVARSCWCIPFRSGPRAHSTLRSTPRVAASRDAPLRGTHRAGHGGRP
jgi:hypothetical protein